VTSVNARAPAHLADAASQRALLMHYRQMLVGRFPLPTFAEAGFGVYSAGFEDGIVLLVLAAAGMHSRTCVEIGAGTPNGSNTANLIVNWGWRGLLIEAERIQLEESRSFYAHQPRVEDQQVCLVDSWVTRDNVNDLLVQNGFGGDIDVMSIDVDGVDYWIWEAVEASQPRVLIVEVQDIWGAEAAVTVPYDAEFDEGVGSGYNYCGASLAAWVKLNRQKGYRLVGCTPQGLNAFFLRADVASEALPEVSAAVCLDQPWLAATRARRCAEAQKRSWVAV
jgi:hypothetical protein